MKWSSLINKTIRIKTLTQTDNSFFGIIKNVVDIDNMLYLVIDISDRIFYINTNNIIFFEIVEVE